MPKIIEDKQKDTTYGLENSGPDLGQAQTC